MFAGIILTTLTLDYAMCNLLSLWVVDSLTPYGANSVTFLLPSVFFLLFASLYTLTDVGGGACRQSFIEVQLPNKITRCLKYTS